MSQLPAAGDASLPVGAAILHLALYHLSPTLTSNLETLWAGRRLSCHETPRDEDESSNCAPWGFPQRRVCALMTVKSNLLHYWPANRKTRKSNESVGNEPLKLAPDS
jgi:hypothetical protein